MDDPGGSRSWYARSEGGARRSLGEALLVSPAGRVIVELDPPVTGVRSGRLRLDGGSRGGSRFDRAHVGVDAVDGPAANAGLWV